MHVPTEIRVNKIWFQRINTQNRQSAKLNSHKNFMLPVSHISYNQQPTPWTYQVRGEAHDKTQR